MKNEPNHELVGTAHPKRAIRPTALTFAEAVRETFPIGLVTNLMKNNDRGETNFSHKV